MKTRSWLVVAAVSAVAMPALADDPAGLSKALKQMDRAAFDTILPAGKTSFYQHKVIEARLPDGKKATVVWGPKKPTQIQVTDQAGWVSRLVVEANPIKRAWYNVAANRRIKNVQQGKAFDTGGPPVDRAVSYQQAAKTLRGAMTGAKLRHSFETKLRDMTRPGNPFGYGGPLK